MLGKVTERAAVTVAYRVGVLQGALVGGRTMVFMTRGLSRLGQGPFLQPQ